MLPASPPRTRYQKPGRSRLAASAVAPATIHGSQSPGPWRILTRRKVKRAVATKSTPRRSGSAIRAPVVRPTSVEVSQKLQSASQLPRQNPNRKSAVEGERVSVRVDSGGRCSRNKKKEKKNR